MFLPHVVEKELVQDDGSVVKRLDCMGVCRNEHWDSCRARCDDCSNHRPDFNLRKN